MPFASLHAISLLCVLFIYLLFNMLPLSLSKVTLGDLQRDKNVFLKTLK